MNAASCLATVNGLQVG